MLKIIIFIIFNDLDIKLFTKSKTQDEMAKFGETRWKITDFSSSLNHFFLQIFRSENLIYLVFRVLQTILLYPAVSGIKLRCENKKNV